MRFDNPSRSRFRSALAAIALSASIGLAACGEAADGPDPGSANPSSAATAEDFSEALDGAPPRLAAIYARGDALLEGGLEAYEAQIAKLEGTPVVVNKWASWCGPCRFEFPFFQSQAIENGRRVAFLGVDSDDSAAAAQTFLEQLPLPYPSFSDPDSDIADALGVRQFPATVFYDSAGEIAYIRYGGYGSEDELAADIGKHAR